MKTNPASFGSIMVYTINDGKPKLPIPDMIPLAFQHNEELSNYSLSDKVIISGKDKDGTVHNAFRNFSAKLDKMFKHDLKRNPKKVIFSESDFYVTPKKKEPRYFLTAATNRDEEYILNELNNGTQFYAVRFPK